MYDIQIIRMIYHRKTCLLVFLSILFITSHSTLFSLSPQFAISFQTSFTQLAHCQYSQQTFQKGFNRFQVTTNPNIDLIWQHKAAGFLEGYATYREIYAAFNNFNKHSLSSGESMLRLYDYLRQQTVFIDKMVRQFQRDQYWQTVGGFLQQTRYAYRGYLQRINQEKRPEMHMAWSQFYQLTQQGDLNELIPGLYNKDAQNEDRGVAFLKVSEGKLLTGHSSINSYTQMVRVFKSYSFGAGRGLTQGIDFTSWPGEIHSRDGFYILTNGLNVLRTSLINKNPKNYLQLKAETVPGWLRAMTANRLAKNIEQWIVIYKKYHSGTFNSQWIIANEVSKDAQMLEEAFSMIKVSDRTEDLTSGRGFVGSYNVAFHPQIAKKIRPVTLKNQDNPYDDNNYARILKAYSPSIKSLQDLAFYLRLNQQENPSQGIAPRNDLNRQNTQASGQIDCKVIQSNRQAYWAISGPTTSVSSSGKARFQPFKWQQFASLSHEGMSAVFNFTWQAVPLAELQMTLSLQ